jgi:hypothetical protein
MANVIRFKRGGGTLPGSYAGSGEPIWDETNAKFHVATNSSAVKWIGAEILDQDDMSSNSATKIATQQSIKKYVDDQVTAQDLDLTIDGSGTYTVDLDSQALNIAGGTGISASASGQTVTIAGSDASTAAKGIALFSADNFATSSGTVTIKNGGVVNAELANSAVTVTAGDGLSGGGSVSLGASTSVALDLNELTSAAVDVANDSIAIVDANDSNGSKKESISDLIAAIDGTGLTATSGVLAIDATQAITNISGNLTVAGNLTVEGDSVVTEVATMQIEDGLIQLAKRDTVDSDDLDIGVYGAYSDDSGTTTEYSGVFRDASTGDGVWTFFDSLTAAPGSGTNAVNIAGAGFNYAGLKCADITGVDDDGTGNAELNGFNIDGGSY